MKRFTLLVILVAAMAPMLLVDRGSAQTRQARRVPGLIDLEDAFGMTSYFQAPAMAEVDKDFEITIFTYGGGCESKGDEEVAISGNTATVKIYDRTTAGYHVACSLFRASFDHTVTLRFTKPGKAIIKIVGQREVISNNPTRRPIRKPFVDKRFITITPAKTQ
jgi:hypothetical protein